MTDPGGVDDAGYILALEERVRAQNLLREFIGLAHATKADHLAALDRMEAISASTLSAIASLSRIPSEVQRVIDNCDVVEIHRTLADSLETDLWAKLADHTQTEAHGLRAFMSRTEASVYGAVNQLRDAAAGKPALPAAQPGASAARRVVVRLQRGAVHLLRACAVVQPAAIVVAAVATAVAAVATSVAAIVVIAHNIATFH